MRHITIPGNRADGDASETCTPRSRTRVAKTEETTTSQCRDYRVGRTVSFIPLAPADRRHIKKPATCPARRAETVVVHPSRAISSHGRTRIPVAANSDVVSASSMTIPGPRFRS